MGVRDLGILGFGDFGWTSDINDAGQVVVNSSTRTGERHAFITGPDGVGVRDIGTLGPYLNYFTWAEGMSDAGQVVGMASTNVGTGPFVEEGLHAFITGPNGQGMTDLNSLINVPDGVVLVDATNINNNGQLVAVGVVPEPEMYAMLLLGLGLIGFLAHGRTAA